MTATPSNPVRQYQPDNASAFKPNYQTVSFEIEAWFYAGQPYAEMPEWVTSRFSKQEMMERGTGRYALRDESGEFWRWMDANEFNSRYVRITP